MYNTVERKKGRKERKARAKLVNLQNCKDTYTSDMLFFSRDATGSNSHCSTSGLERSLTLSSYGAVFRSLWHRHTRRMMRPRMMEKMMTSPTAMPTI